VVASVSNIEGKMVLETCFESDNDAFLFFVESGEEGFFNLSVSNETVKYKGFDYRVFQAEKITRLLINLETKDSILNNQRFAYGRSINDASPMPQYYEPYNIWETSGQKEEILQKEDAITQLRVLMGYLDQVSAGEIDITPQELADMEQTVTRIKVYFNL
jgi:hypothetical protein